MSSSLSTKAPLQTPAMRGRVALITRYVSLTELSSVRSLKDRVSTMKIPVDVDEIRLTLGESSLWSRRLA